MLITADEGYADEEYLLEFEISMAISDLIFELNRIMDWHSSPVEEENVGGSKFCTYV